MALTPEDPVLTLILILSRPRRGPIPNPNLLATAKREPALSLTVSLTFPHI